MDSIGPIQDATQHSSRRTNCDGCVGIDNGGHRTGPGNDASLVLGAPQRIPEGVSHRIASSLPFLCVDHRRCRFIAFERIAPVGIGNGGRVAYRTRPQLSRRSCAASLPVSPAPELAGRALLPLPLVLLLTRTATATRRRNELNMGKGSIVMARPRIVVAEAPLVSVTNPGRQRHDVVVRVKDQVGSFSLGNPCTANDTVGVTVNAIIIAVVVVVILVVIMTMTMTVLHNDYLVDVIASVGRFRSGVPLATIERKCVAAGSGEIVVGTRVKEAMPMASFVDVQKGIFAPASPFHVVVGFVVVVVRTDIVGFVIVVTIVVTIAVTIIPTTIGPFPTIGSKDPSTH